MKLVAYAEDTYVLISGDTYDEVKTRTEEVMTQHDDFLVSIGMKTNVTKTELSCFSKKSVQTTPIVVKGSNIFPRDGIKILGIKFKKDLSWDDHVNSLRGKAMLANHKLRFLSKLVDKDAMKKIITAHYFGILYYASPVWLTELTTAKQWKCLNSLYYQALRTGVRDHQCRLDEQNLNRHYNRATPLQWMMYSCCKLAISLFLLDTSGPPLSAELQKTSYINDRKPGVATFMDTSRLKIGRYSFCNRLSSMKNVNFDWITGIEKDRLRIALKKTFIK